MNDPTLTYDTDSLGPNIVLSDGTARCQPCFDEDHMGLALAIVAATGKTDSAPCSRCGRDPRIRRQLRNYLPGDCLNCGRGRLEYVVELRQGEDREEKRLVGIACEKCHIYWTLGEGEYVVPEEPYARHPLLLGAAKPPISRTEVAKSLASLRRAEEDPGFVASPDFYAAIATGIDELEGLLEGQKVEDG